MLRRCAVLSVLGIAASACALFESERTDPLPRPAADQIRPSNYQPDKPFEFAAGVSTRSAYSTRSETGYRIEVRDFLVAPSATPVEVPFISNSAALIEVREGAGLAMTGETSVQLTPGVVFTVLQGTPLRVQAKGEPLTFRAHLYRQE